MPIFEVFQDGIDNVLQPGDLLKKLCCNLPSQLPLQDETNILLSAVAELRISLLVGAFSWCHLGGLGSDKDVISPSATACKIAEW